MRLSHTILSILSICIALLVCVSTYAQVEPKPSPGNDCPSMSVTGPAGIVEPGETGMYVVELIGKVPPGITFKWSLSEGGISEGQGTRSIKVVFPEQKGGVSSSTATVEVVGLSPGCPNTASETYSIVIDYIPMLLDEFSIGPSMVNKKALAAAADDLSKNANNQLYIIEYFRAGTSKKSVEKKLAMIRAYMTRSLKFDGSRITIITDVAHAPLTKIYRVPPGADNPAP